MRYVFILLYFHSFEARKNTPVKFCKTLQVWDFSLIQREYPPLPLPRTFFHVRLTMPFWQENFSYALVRMKHLPANMTYAIVAGNPFIRTSAYEICSYEESSMRKELHKYTLPSGSVSDNSRIHGRFLVRPCPAFSCTLVACAWLSHAQATRVQHAGSQRLSEEIGFRAS